MENKELAYKLFVERLRNNEPLLKNQEQMIQSTVEKINRFKLKNRKLRIVSLLSGAVAALLLCLLVQDVIYIHDSEMYKTVAVQGTTVKISSNSLKNKSVEEIIHEKTAWMQKKERLLLIK